MKTSVSQKAVRAKNIVMSKGGTEMQLDEFREMISQYSATAHALMERRRQLAEELKAERDINRIKELELRKSTIEAERYEVLEDMRALIGYVKEREKCRGED